VRIRFRTRKLERQYTNYQEANRAYGKEVARKFIQRVNIIKHVSDIEELREMPGLRYHELKGNLQGLWAVKLTGFYRLLFTLEGNSLEVVCIEEVSKHYGD